MRIPLTNVELAWGRMSDPGHAAEAAREFARHPGQVAREAVSYTPGEQAAHEQRVAALESDGQRLDAAISGLELARTPGEIEAAMAELDERRSPVSQSVSGKDGAGSWYADVMAGGPDINPEMMGRAKYEIYREMRLTDPAIRSLLWMTKLPVRAADYSVEANDRDPDGVEAASARADALAWQFGLERHETPQLDLTWDELTQQDLLFLDFGAMGGEIVWGDMTTWVDEDGDEHPVRPIARIAPRFAATVHKIEVNQKTGRIEWIEQDLPDAERIKGEKLVWFALEREGDNYWGMSFLRSAYGPWKLKRNMMVNAAIAFDRFSAGVPWIKHPSGKKRQAEEMGRNYRVHERAWLTTEEPSLSEPTWAVEILGGNQTIADPTPLLRYYDQQIAVNGLQQFSSLGTTERGSRAVGEVLADPYYLAVQAIAKYLLTERSRSVARRFFDVNFGVDVPLPKLKVSKIQGRNIPVLARAMADLSAAGFTFTDRDTQNDVRDQMDLRHLPELEEIVDDLPEDIGIAPANVPPVEGGPIPEPQPEVEVVAA